MMLVEKTTIQSSSLPIAQFRDHLQLGSGFADDTAQDAILEVYLRSAIAMIEGRTGKALLVRLFKWTVTAWRDLARQTLPVAPVEVIESLTIVDRQGGAQVVEPQRYRLEPDTHRPRLASTSMFLPGIPIGGAAEIEFRAGFAETWDDVPADLRQAVFLLAAHFYERRSEASGGEGRLPYGVTTLIERYRNVRLFGGA